MTPDTELVERTLEGDRQAAADLVERYAAGVYAVCLGLLADPDQAQDIAQEALLKGISRLNTLQNPAAFRSWIISIARNLCRDSWKQSRRQQELLDQQINLEVVPGMGTGQPVTEDVQETDIQSSLARLPEKHRLPLLLFYFDGLSTASVAEALDISQTGAATRLCRARRALRAILEVNHD